MTDGYFIEKGTSCDLGAEASELHGPYKKFINAVNASDSADKSLLWGRSPLKIFRDFGGERLEVWPGPSSHLIDL